MRTDNPARTWIGWTVVVAGLALALARFIRYIEVVTDVDVAFTASLAWWGMFVAGLGLILYGLVDELEGSEFGPSTQAWAALLVGLLILTIMPASPAPGAELRDMFGGMFGLIL